MIHGNHSTLQMPSWQNQLARSIKDPEKLLKALELPLKHLPALQQAHQLFPLRVTESYLNRIEKGNFNDPLLRQILPSASETIISPQFSQDPVGDKASEIQPGLLHKYKNRVLLTLTAACGIHCRYCFRRHFDYSSSNAAKYWQDNLAYIQQHTEINEVIFSGGDPLSLNDQKLEIMVNDIATITHIKTLRIHTRQAIVLPERIDSALINWASNKQLNIVFVVHVNHPNEINTEVDQALSKLSKVGVTLLNQSVLLANINDSCEVLRELSNKLFSIGVMPYYLHLLDKVQGAAHFDVNEICATQIMNELRKELPGYLVPRLVKEIPNEASKTPVI